MICILLLGLSFVDAQDNSTKKILMIRHGARSPTSYSELEKELWSGYRPGQLTEIGFEME